MSNIFEQSFMSSFMDNIRSQDAFLRSYLNVPDELRHRMVYIKSSGLMNMIQNNQNFIMTLSKNHWKMFLDEISHNSFHSLDKVGIFLRIRERELIFENNDKNHILSRIIDPFDLRRDLCERGISFKKSIFGSFMLNPRIFETENNLLRSIDSGENIYLFVFDDTIGFDHEVKRKREINLNLFNQFNYETSLLHNRVGWGEEPRPRMAVGLDVSSVMF